MMTVSRARPLGWLRDLSVILALSGLFLLGLEAATRVGERLVRGAPVDARVHADVYAGASWVPELYRELAACDRVEHAAYVGWRRRAYAGPLVNVGAEGLRRTCNPALHERSGAREVLFFGGSTMWGTGVRDEHTLPSAVARRLASRPGAAVRCVNEGETGFVSTQELIRLELCLRAGDSPDVVVFLDGVNDVFAAFQSHEAGLPHNESFRRHEFNLLRRPAALWYESVRQTVASSELIRLLRREARVSPLEEGLARHLANEVARVYAQNVALVQALARARGFRALFYLQPVVFTKPTLTEFEQRDATERDYARRFYLDCYEQCRERLAGVADFHDLSGIFAAETAPRFLDFCHLGEPGNEALADRIAPDVARCLASREALSGIAPAR